MQLDVIRSAAVIDCDHDCDYSRRGLYHQG